MSPSRSLTGGFFFDFSVRDLEYSISDWIKGFGASFSVNTAEVFDQGLGKTGWTSHVHINRLQSGQMPEGNSGKNGWIEVQIKNVYAQLELHELAFDRLEAVIAGGADVRIRIFVAIGQGTEGSSAGYTMYDAIGLVVQVNPQAEPFEFKQ